MILFGFCLKQCHDDTYGILPEMISPPLGTLHRGSNSSGISKRHELQLMTPLPTQHIFLYLNYKYCKTRISNHDFLHTRFLNARILRQTIFGEKSVHSATFRRKVRADFGKNWRKIGADFGKKWAIFNLIPTGFI